MLWIFAILNILASAAAFYVSQGIAASAGSVRDMLQILGGVSLLTALALIYIQVQKNK
jgi:hypothetical protein